MTKEDIYSQVKLALSYKNGWETEKNESEAIRYFRMAVEHGLEYTEFCDCVYDLVGGKVNGSDEAEAQIVDLLQIAAEWGYNPDWQYELGLHYELGWGVEVSPQKANFWYMKAAEYYKKLDGQCHMEYAGTMESQYQLGLAYEVGYGSFEISFEKAANYYKKALKRGRVGAAYALHFFESCPAEKLEIEENNWKSIVKDKPDLWYKKIAEERHRAVYAELHGLKSCYVGE